MANLTIADLVRCRHSKCSSAAHLGVTGDSLNDLSDNLRRLRQIARQGRGERQCALFDDKALDGLIARNTWEPLYRPHRRRSPS
jgi:hypothetical protein